MKTLQSQLSLNKFSNFSGFTVSALVHAFFVVFLFHHPFEQIKPAENKSIKINLHSFNVPTSTVEISSAPQIAPEVMIPEPTPPAPVLPPKEAEKPKPIQPIKEIKPQPKKMERKKVEKKIEKPKEIAHLQPTLTQNTPPANVANPNNLPTTNAVQAAAPIAKIAELNLSNSAGSEEFKKIVDAIVKNQRYPKNAKKMRQQGVAEVKFLIRKNGSVDEIKIAKSSGYASLDEGAINNVKRASKDFPMLGADYYINIPISFRLL
ncbi:energy transducer TonB [Campylobacter californiensis]|uniref:energy transducer TonB n=1 Tax=Campylobacter californiensis TaxID=1032243 RepID=UPI001D15BF23|nr:energy transducer TonB [Campylobacter sp. RM13119]